MGMSRDRSPSIPATKVPLRFIARSLYDNYSIYGIIVCTCTHFVPYNVPYYQYNHRLVLIVRQIVDAMPIYGHFYIKIPRYSSKTSQKRVKFDTFHSCTLFSTTFQPNFNQNRVQLVGYKNFACILLLKNADCQQISTILVKSTLGTHHNSRSTSLIPLFSSLCLYSRRV